MCFSQETGESEEKRRKEEEAREARMRKEDQAFQLEMAKTISQGQLQMTQMLMTVMQGMNSSQMPPMPSMFPPVVPTSQATQMQESLLTQPEMYPTPAMPQQTQHQMAPTLPPQHAFNRGSSLQDGELPQASTASDPAQTSTGSIIRNAMDNTSL